MNLTMPRMDRKRQLGADVLLLLVTAIWGGTFVMVKDAVASYPVFPFLAIRFGLGLAALLLIGWRRLRFLTRSNLMAGALAGLFLLGGYAFQTLGLQHTTASKAAFITGLSVAMVPVLSALVLRVRPSSSAVIGVSFATAGLGLLTLSHSLMIGRGDLYVLLGALCFALHILALSASAPKVDPIALTIVQLAVVALCSTAISFASLRPWPVPTTSVWGAAIFTGILATAVAFGLQTAMQRFTTATHTALIFTAEPVFGALFGVLYASDVLTPRMLVGAFLILIGTLISEINWSERTARLISRFLAPHYVLGASLILLALTGPESWRVGITWVVSVAFPSVLIMLGVFTRALRKGTISDWHVSDRRERLAPVLIVASLLFSGIPALLYYLLQGPRLLLAASMAAFVLVAINMVITLLWKISQHVSGIALGTTLLALTLGPLAAPSLLLIPLVAWARVKIGAHTIMQTVAGCCTGVFVTVMTLRWLGLA
jgi:drug/metabolite transporter (DMT)-like permease/membrane-associated phospholipid phosphatase